MSLVGGHRPAAELAEALGLEFRDQGLLRQALTHRSYVNETNRADSDSYERLEFLGDVVVRLIVSEELYHRLPDCDEGGLTRRWTALLSQRALAIAAERLGVAPYLMLGRGFESTGGRHNEAVLGDVMESLIAALYLDGGIRRPGISCCRRWPVRSRVHPTRIGVRTIPKQTCRSFCKARAGPRRITA